MIVIHDAAEITVVHRRNLNGRTGQFDVLLLTVKDVFGKTQEIKIITDKMDLSIKEVQA